ncbi:hypothetical protein HID58_021905, partial [Brassica napus]
TQRLLIFRTLSSTLCVLSPKSMSGLFFHVLNTGNDNMVVRVIVIEKALNMLRSFAKLKQFLKSREPFGMAQGGNFSGIYRKPLKWDGEGEEERPVEVLMILKYGGVLTHAGRKQL